MIYAFVDIMKNHFFMSTLFLLSNETFNSRSTRRKRFLSLSRNDDEKNDDDNSKNDENENDKNDKNNENDKNDDVENEETQTTRQKQSERNLEENKNDLEKKRSTCRLILNRLAIRMTSM